MTKTENLLGPKEHRINLRTFLQRCNPKLWRCSVRSMVLDEPNAAPIVQHWEMPDDRDVAAEIARRGGGPGRYAVKIVAKGRGESFTRERARLRMTTNQRLPSGILVVSRDLAEAPPEPKPPAGQPGIESLRREAEAERLLAEQAEFRAERRKHEAKAAEIEAQQQKKGSGATDELLRELISARQPQSDTLSLLLPVLLKFVTDLIDDGKQREQRLLDTLTRMSAAPQEQLAPPPRTVDPMRSLTQQAEQMAKLFDVVKTIRGTVGDGDKEPKGELASLVSEAKEALELVRELRGGSGRPAAEASGAGNRLITGQTATRPASQGARPAGQERVRAFARALFVEIANGSDPQAVADSSMDSIGLLPAPVRQALEAGNWRAAWHACAPFLGAEEWKKIDQGLNQNQEATAWCEAFAKAVPDDEPAMATNGVGGDDDDDEGDTENEDD